MTVRVEPTKGLDVRRPGVRTRGDIPLPNILDRWASHRPLRRRHSGKGRAVPEQRPSILFPPFPSFVSALNLFCGADRSRMRCWEGIASRVPPQAQARRVGWA